MDGLISTITISRIKGELVVNININHEDSDALVDTKKVLAGLVEDIDNINIDEIVERDNKINEIVDRLRTKLEGDEINE